MTANQSCTKLQVHVCTKSIHEYNLKVKYYVHTIKLIFINSTVWHRYYKNVHGPSCRFIKYITYE